MANWNISQEMRINGVTPVDNLFISEFMLSAPSDFVKVYLYGLMQCYMGMDFDMEAMAKDLSMSEKKVSDAFSYWVRKGLIKNQSEFYVFQSTRTVVYCDGVPKSTVLSKYTSFNAALGEIMSGRMLLPADFEIAYDWIEIYGMSSECVLEMVHFAVSQKYKAGVKVSFNTLNKLAASWSEMGIKTGEKARDYVNSQKVITSKAKTILQHLGQYRNPTVDEFNLLEKWTKEYGFSLETLLECCSQMVYSKSPSFALLDSIVERYHSKGISDLEDVEQAKSKDDKMFNMYKEIVKRCGGYGSATKAQKELIDALIEQGFNEQGLLYICDYSVSQDKKGLAHVEKLAKELAKAGITEENAICDEIDKRNLESERVKEFLECVGFTRRPNKQDIDSYQRYYGIFGDHEIMLKAALFASNHKNKTEHLEHLLEDWKQKGISSAEHAVDIAPAVKKKDMDKKGYIKSGETYSDKDLFDI